jgi:hypothetical protein
MSWRPPPPVVAPLAKGRFYEAGHYDLSGVFRCGEPIAMTDAAFERLLDYSRTNPSGVYDGKIWRRCIREPVVRDPAAYCGLRRLPDYFGRWVRCRYFPSPRYADRCATEVRPIVTPNMLLVEIARRCAALLS